MNRISAPLLAAAALLHAPAALAAEDTPKEESRLELGSLRLKLSGVLYALWAIDLEAANPDSPSPNGANRFEITRAYINVEPQITENISLRITPDITRVSGTEGNIDGSLALRLKYAYAQFANVAPGLNVKAGIQQNAWIDFEDTIWGYRVLGPSALEFFTGVASADLGLGAIGKHAGGAIDYQATVFNGEGYSKAEQTNREAAKYKEVAGRLTMTPFAESPDKNLQRLKFSFFTQYGIQRSVEDHHVERIRMLASATYQHRLFTLGASGGPTWDGKVGEGGEVTNQQGLLVSTFAWVDLPLNLRPLVRFDWFDPDVDTSPSDPGEESSTGYRTRLIAGLAYRFSDKVQVIADYQDYGFQEPENAPANLAGKVFFVHLEAKY